MTHVVSLAVAMILGAVHVAAAQSPQAAVEVRGGFGLSRYLHGDLGYSAPSWLGAVRVGRGPLVVEAELAGAAHEERQVFGPAPGSPVPTVAISTDVFRSAAANVLGRWGRTVNVFAGGGPGLYWEQSGYRLEAGTGSYDQKQTRGPRVGAQLVAGLDVPVASRIKAFGQFRYEMRSFADPGGGSVVQFFGGVSFGIL
jgi:hypothetical protein